ncbi:MAG: thiolase domain-containing protein [Clostridiales Family XIII bacterium]|jgi:acetyl-CoA C-acetyltransferase|nr:thiolase domain-containing protein [Clostridiales Family XIII bacterium]
MRSVSIIGIGETRLGKLAEYSLSDMIKEAGGKAIEDAGLEAKDIQAAYIGNFNGSYLNNQSHLSAMVTETLGFGTIPVTRTEAACASGGEALRQGFIGILSGLYDIVLVGDVEKMTHQSTGFVTAAVASAMDYEKEAMEGITFPACFAMIANRYFYEYRNVKKEMAMCAVNAHHNGCLNPDAQMQKEITIEKVMDADLIASPLSLYDCSLVTDGAVFAVLAATEIAEKISKKRIVEIVGSGHSGDKLTLYNKKNITTFSATLAAAKEAYSQAGLQPDDIDFAEVHDCFTITQIINTEDLGFFEKGKGGDAVSDGTIAIDGKKPINPSGGLKAKGHAIGATGISQIFELVTQIRGDAAARQVKKSDIGIAHNLGGSAGTCVVHILKGR